MRVIVASAVLVLVVTVFLSGVRAWAIAHVDERCRRAPVPVASADTTATPHTPTGVPYTPTPAAHGSKRQWRLKAFRAAGCGAWHGARHRMHHPDR
jgi:hypothetical protein